MTTGFTKTTYLYYWAIAIAATAVVMLLCFMVGSGDAHGLSLGWPSPDIFVWRVRPVLAAAIVGAALAGAGVVLQSMLRNPLADPLILGIAGGANLAAASWMLYSGFFLVVAPFLGEAAFATVGAILSILVVFFLARRRGTTALEPVTVLLVGIVVSAFAGAATLLLQSMAPPQMKQDILNYLLGYISDGVLWGPLAVGFLVFGVGWSIALLSGNALNIASLSDEEITSLGVRLSRLRSLSFISASIMTAAAVCLAGPIGFVGLICPHVCRALFGPDHRQLMVTAPFAGAIFLMLAHAFVHGTGNWLFNGDIPIGVVSALCGGPFFLILLRKRGVWDER